MAKSLTAERQNTGGRLERFILHAMRNKQELNTLDALGHALGLPDEVQGLDRQHQVANLITSVISELRRMKAQLQDQGVPAELLDHYTAYAEQALSVGNLNNPWKTTIANYLGTDVLLALKWYAHVLPDDAVTSTPEEVAELSGLLDELEEAVAKPGIPVALSQFIRKQIDAIKTAVRLFPVTGIAPIRAAARAMAADVHLDDDEIRTAARQGDPEAVAEVGGKLKRTWEKAVHIAGDVEKLGKAGKTVLEVGEFFGKLLN